MNAIKKYRKIKHLTQSEMADALKIESSTVCKWETNKSLPRAELLPKLAELLSCTVDELLANTDSKSVSA